MAVNEYVNKVETVNNEVLMNISEDTVTEDDVLKGKTFHLANGAPAVGTYIPSDEIEARLRATVGHSSKNLLKLEASTQTTAGITYTINESNGTVTANGTVTTGQNSYYNVDMDLPEGNYYFYGCPTGGSNSKYDVFPWDNTTTARPKQWDGTTEAVSDYDMTPKQFKIIAGHSLRLSIRIRSGQTVNNLVFKPMVWDGSISDNSFEPYQEPTDSLIETKTRAYLNSTVGHSNINLFNEKYRQGTSANLTITTAVTSKTIVQTAIGQKHIFHRFNQDYAYVIYGLNSAGVSELLSGKIVSTSNRLYDSGYIRQFKYVYENNVSGLVAYIIMIRKPQTSGGSDWINITPDSIDQNIIMVTEYPITSDTFVPYQEPTDTLIETKARAYLTSTVGHTCKNLLELSETSETVNGVNFTIDKIRGTVTTANTASDQIIKRIGEVTNNSDTAKNYWLSGSANNGTNNSYYLYAIDDSTDSRPKQWDGVTNSLASYELNDSVQIQIPVGHKIRVQILIRNGVNADGLVFKPMLREASIADDTFEPYQEPTDKLIETKDRAYLNSTIGHACKNLLDLTKNIVSTDVTNIVINPKTGSVSANASGSWKSIYFIDENIKFENGKTYVVSCKNNAVNTSGSLAIRHRVTNIIYKGASFNTLGVKSITFTPNTTDLPNGWTISLFITNASGADSSIDISELMLKEVSISDDTFEPYQEPTDSLIETKVKTYLNSTVGHSSKNLLEVPNGFRSFNGVTYTADEAAGTITASGTATSDAQLDFQGSSPKSVNSGIIKNGLIYSCEGTNVNLVCAISYYNSSGTYISEQRATTSGTIISIPSNANSYKFWVRKRPAAGSETFIFKPMLREAFITDDTFEPHQIPTDEAKMDKPVELVSTATNTFIYPSVSDLKSKYSMLLVTFANSSRSNFASVWIPTNTIKNNINEQSNYNYASTGFMNRSAPVSIWDDGVHISSAESDETIISIQAFPK